MAVRRKRDSWAVRFGPVADVRLTARGERMRWASGYGEERLVYRQQLGYPGHIRGTWMHFGFC